MVSLWQCEGASRGTMYKGVAAEDVGEMVDAVQAGAGAPERLAFASDQPFFTRQMRVVREFAGTFDPEDLEDNIRVGAYRSLMKAVTEMAPAEVIQEISTSGLRGRGGRDFRRG